MKVASEYANFDLTPYRERPELMLSPGGYPMMKYDVGYGEQEHESKFVLVLSPEYQNGFRPAIGVEVEAKQILGWTWLLVEF